MSIKYLSFPLIAILIWAFNTIVSKLSAGAIDPGVISFDRWLLAGLVMTPFMAQKVWANRVTVLSHLPKIIVFSFLGMVLFQSLAYYAAASTSATNMGLIGSLMPLNTMLFSALLLKERPTTSLIVGAALSMFGILILVTKGLPFNLMNQGIAIGDGLMLIGTIAYGAYSVLLRKWAVPLPPWQMLYMQIMLAALMLLPVYLLSPHSPITPENLPLVLFAGIFSSIIAGFFWMQGVVHLGANRAMLFMNLLPVFVALFAVVALNEKLHAFHIVGGLVTLSGVLLAELPKLRRTTSTSPTLPTNK
ncbi:MAG: DMT family transporter [Pseudomonadota bacterium]